MTISSLLKAGAAAVALGAAAEWSVARPDYRWSFPRDHWAHPDYRTEWWYFTGHLAAAGDSAPRYAYQFTVFRVGVLAEAPALASDWATQMLIMGHAAVTDVATGRHLFSEVLYRAVPALGGFGAPGDTLVAWSRGPAGTPGRWTLVWNGDGFDITAADSAQGFGFALRTRAAKPPAFQGPNGFSRKGPGADNASLYYSFTRLATTGRLRVGERSAEVSGTSWMDKEFFSNHLTDAQTGWDWFSLQLDDGREVMLYHLRDATGAATWASGTVVPRGAVPAPGGGARGVRWLDSSAFRLEPLGRWTSAASGASYPVRWRVRIPGDGLDLTLEPVVNDQENRSRILPRLFYWEGAVRVRDAAGRAVGRGFVELVGYGRGRRPAL